MDRCSGCGQRFEQRLYTTSWSNCGCNPQRGHRIYICLRGTCRAETFDPPHDGTAMQAPREGTAGKNSGMTGAIGLPEDPEDLPIETEGVGEDSGSLPQVETLTDSDAGTEPPPEATDEEDLAAGRS